MPRVLAEEVIAYCELRRRVAYVDMYTTNLKELCRMQWMVETNSGWTQTLRRVRFELCVRNLYVHEYKRRARCVLVLLMKSVNLQKHGAIEIYKYLAPNMEDVDAVEKSLCEDIISGLTRFAPFRFNSIAHIDN